MTTTYEIMSENIVTINENAFLKDAYKLMKEKSIRHLPVMSNSGKILGMLSDRDLKLAMKRLVDFDENICYQFDSEEIVSDYMTSPVHFLYGTEQLEVAIEKMLKDKISALLVRDLKNKIVGIITTDDMLAYLLTTLKNEQRSQYTIFNLLGSSY